jgi:hypothetical protein
MCLDFKLLGLFLNFPNNFDSCGAFICKVIVVKITIKIVFEEIQM